MNEVVKCLKVIVFLVLTVFAYSQENNIFLNAKTCKNGDFVFVSGNTSSFDDAIVSVTKNKENIDFSHVGLLHCTDSGLFIIEAVTKGVSHTPLDTFLHKNSNSIIKIARLKTEYQQYIHDAIANALVRLGKKYDFAFDLENDTYYCSELLYVAFVEASGDSLFFETPPMTFKDMATNKFHHYWITYFEALNIDIPEGKLGLNPNGMSLSEKLEWVVIN